MTHLVLCTMKNSRVLLRVLLRLVSTLSAGAVTAALFPGALGGDTRALLGLNLAVWLNLALVDFALAAVLFGLICKVMSHARVTRHDVRIGAVFTALLFTIGKALIGQYVEHSGISSAPSAGDLLVVLLFWWRALLGVCKLRPSGSLRAGTSRWNYRLPALSMKHGPALLASSDQMRWPKAARL